MNINIQKFLKDFKYYLPAKIISALSGFLLIILYSRYLSANEYGYFDLTLNTINFAIILLYSWINESNLRYFKKYKKQKKEKKFITNNILIVLFIFFILLILFFLFNSVITNFYNDIFLVYLKIGIFIILFKELYQLIQTSYRADRNSKGYSINIFVFSIFKLVFAVIILFYLDEKAKYLLISFLILYITFSILNLYNLQLNIKKDYLFDWNITREVFLFGLPLIGVKAQSILLSIGDRFLIQYYMQAEDLGVYAMGYNLINMSMRNMYMLLLLISYPILIDDFETKGENIASKTLKNHLAYYLLLFTPIVFGVWVLNENLVNLILTPDYSDTIIIIPWVTLGIYFLGISQYINKSFQLKERTKLLFFILFFSSVINIVLNMIFIPKFGIEGAAYSTVLSYVIVLIVSFAISSKIFMLKLPLISFLKIIISSILMVLVLLFLNSILLLNFYNLIIEIIICVFIYSIMLFILKENVFIELIYNIKDIFYKKIIKK